MGAVQEVVTPLLMLFLAQVGGYVFDRRQD